eukprot:scaffold1982_cov115-Isochrysis_galbana.AAC.1
MAAHQGLSSRYDTPPCMDSGARHAAGAKTNRGRELARAIQREHTRGDGTPETKWREGESESKWRAETKHGNEKAETKHEHETAETKHGHETAETKHGNKTAGMKDGPETASTKHGNETAETNGHETVGLCLVKVGWASFVCTWARGHWAARERDWLKPRERGATCGGLQSIIFASIHKGLGIQCLPRPGAAVLPSAPAANLSYDLFSARAITPIDRYALVGPRRRDAIHPFFNAQFGVVQLMLNHLCRPAQLAHQGN